MYKHIGMVGYGEVGKVADQQAAGVFAGLDKSADWQAYADRLLSKSKT